MMCALAVLIMLIGSFIQILDLTAAAAAGLTVVFAMIELGKKYALLVYAVSSLLALVLLPYKSPAVIFVLFAGIYPVLKEILHRIKNKTLAYTAKLLVFNLFFTGIIYIGRNLFGLTDDFYGFNTDILGIAIYLFGNAVFIVYDIALDRLVVFYSVKIKRIFDKSYKI